MQNEKVTLENTETCLVCEGTAPLCECVTEDYIFHMPPEQRREYFIGLFAECSPEKGEMVRSFLTPPTIEFPNF